MAVTSFTLIAPVDDQDFGATLRPAINVVWIGGTGPFDVVYEWDTNAAFTAPIVVTNKGVTTPDSAVPTSDLGPFGTAWYCRATIYDLADTGTDEIQSVYNDATGGTLDLDFDGQPATAIPWNESAANLKTALEALSNITTVGVTGTGTSGDPWIVTFTDPGDQDVPMLTADDTNLTGHTIGTTISESTKGVYPTGTQSPGTYQTLTFTDPNDHPRLLHLNADVVVGFGTDGVGDGDPDLFPRLLYMNSNVGPGWDDALGDVSPETPGRTLYLNANVTSDQPCPYVQKIAPTLVQQGAALAVYGDSFGATPSTWGGEVRLYENQDLSGSYVAMAVNSWSDTELSVVVPVAASTGWVTVVHTTGTPTCVSSARKLLTVEQKVANSDAGWWLKTANRVNVIEPGSTVLPSNNVETAFKKIMNAIGSGSVTLPLGDPIIEEFVDPVTRKGRLVQTYIDDRMRYAWFAEKLAHDYDEDGNAVAVISGRGMEVVALHNKLGPHDFPASPTQNPTWVYGSTDNFIQNPGFDDAADNPIINNPGGEDGNDDDGNAKGWSKEGDNVNSITAIQDSLFARTDDWYIEVDADRNHSGMKQSFTVVPNKEYHVRTYVKDETAAGMRVTLRLEGATDMSATTTYGNNYEWEDGIYAELGNVARNPADNDCPGGATDGTWQVMDVEVKTGDEQTSLDIIIQDDHHSVCGDEVHVPFGVDDVEIEGWGLGLDPWQPFRSPEHASNSFRLQSNKTYDGSAYGATLNPLLKYAGIEQIVQVNPLTKYTMTIWAWTDLLAGDDAFKLVARKNDGLDTQIGNADEQVPNDEGWTQYQTIFTTDDVTEELIFRFAYVGPNNPNPVYLDSASLLPGEPPSPAGVILNAVLDKMAEDDKLLYLQRTFTDTQDSKGAAWPSALSMDLDSSESLYGLLSRLVALGHEWEIVPVSFAEGGETGFELNVYTARAFNPDSGIGINHTGDPEGPVIMPGDATIGGRILKTAFNTNSVLAIGDDGVWSRAQQAPWNDVDMEAGDPSDHGYRESFGDIEEVISVSAGDATTIAQFAEARLADAKARESAVQLVMQRSAVIRPFLTFNVGSSIFVDLPPTDADPPLDDGEGGFRRSYPKRIRALQAALAGEGSEITFMVDIDRVIYEDELAWYAMIAQLAERAPSENSGVGTGSVSGSGGAVSVVVGGGASGDVPLHTHSLKSTEIKDKAASGDVSGSLPGPVTVNAIKGRPFSGTIPTATDPVDPLAVVPVFDRDTLTWTPTEFEGGAAGGGSGATSASAAMSKDTNQTLSTAAYTKLLWTTEDFAAGGVTVDLTNNHFVVAAAGQYIFTIHLQTETNINDFRVKPYVNDIDTDRYMFRTDIVVGWRGATGTLILDLAAGDEVSFYGYSNVAGAVIRGTSPSFVSIALVGAAIIPTGDTDWHLIGDTGEPAFANSWVNYLLNWPEAAYRIDGDGYVHLTGVIKSGTISTTLPAFTLPIGYRPLLSGAATEGNIYVVIADSKIGRVNVYADGTVTIAAPTTNPWVSLDGISFKADV